MLLLTLIERPPGCQGAVSDPAQRCRPPDLTTAGVAEILRGMRMAIAVNALGLRQAGGLPIGREQRFTLARMARDQERVYRRLLEQRNPRVDGDSGGAPGGV
jgi:hypothetical protein